MLGKLDGLLAQTHYADMGADACQQLARTEGLNQIVVGAGLQSFDPRFFTRPGGKQDHRRGMGAGVGTQGLQQAETIQVRHHDVA